MFIREMKPSDQAVFLEMMEAFYSSDAVLHAIPRPQMERVFQDSIDGGPYIQGFLFETDEGEAAGFVLLSHGYSTEAGGECIQIEDLYVQPQYRGMGMAKECFAYLLKRFPQASRFRLEAEPGNANAIKLYKRLGFEAIGYAQMILEPGEGNS